MPSADSEDIVKASEIFCLLWTVVLKHHKYCPNGEFATNQEFMYVPLEPVVNCSIIGIVICSIRGQMSASGELWEITLLGGADNVSSVCSVFHSYEDLCFKLSV